MSATVRQIVFWLVIVAGALLIYKLVNPSNSRAQLLSYDELVAKVRMGEIEKLTIKQTEIIATDSGGHELRVQLDNQSLQRDLVNLALEEDDAGKPHVGKIETQVSSSFVWTLLTSWAPFILIILIWIFMLKQMQTGGRTALDFGKSRAAEIEVKDKLPTFNDVAGAREAKIALQELTEFLQNPKKWQALGARIPKGCLMIGPPGCGKTLLARAVAGEAGVRFFNVSGTDFVEMFVGVGAARVRDVFERCRKKAPCVLFIDELDSIGRKRGSGIGGGHDEREQTLNQLLVAMDGFESNEGVVVLAATNRADVLDKALIRPGRFDRQIKVPLPDGEERVDILRIHTREKPLSDDVDLGVVAQQTPAFSGADLMNLANEAALQAIRRSSNTRVIDDHAPILPPIRDSIRRDPNPRVRPSQHRSEAKNVLTMQDFDKALELIRSGREIFSSLDLVLIESATQLSEPMEKLFVRLSLTDQTIDGELLWANSSYIKYRSSTEGHEVILPKSNVLKFELLDFDVSYAADWNA